MKTVLQFMRFLYETLTDYSYIDDMFSRCQKVILHYARLLVTVPCYYKADYMQKYTNIVEPTRQIILLTEALLQTLIQINNYVEV